MVRVFNDLKTFADVVLFIGLLVICFSLVIYSFTLLWMSFFTTLFGFFSSPIAGAISSLPHVLMVVISIIIFVLFLLNPLLLLHPIILPLKLLILNIPHQFEHRIIIFLLSWLRLNAGLNNLLRFIQTNELKKAMNLIVWHEQNQQKIKMFLMITQNTHWCIL